MAEQREYSGGASGLGISTKTKGRQVKRRSVSFEDDLRDLSSGNASGGERKRVSREFLTEGKLPSALKKTSEQEMEERRRERRREEAKAAIEVGAFTLFYCASRKMVLMAVVTCSFE